MWSLAAIELAGITKLGTPDGGGLSRAGIVWSKRRSMPRGVRPFCFSQSGALVGQHADSKTEARRLIHFDFSLCWLVDLYRTIRTELVQ